jgi:hypothetical protein
MNMEDNNSRKKVSSSKSDNYFIGSISTISSFTASIKAEGRIFIYDKKISSNDKIRLSYWLWSSKDLLIL